MSINKGSEGLIKVGTVTVAEVKSWSVDESADTLETTTMGDTARTYSSSLTTFTGSCDCFYDIADTTGQGAFAIGASVTVAFQPEGDTSGDTIYTGSVIVTGSSKSSSFDGIVDVSFTFQGSGTLATSTVA
jgi:hypothetical protein